MTAGFWLLNLAALAAFGGALLAELRRRPDGRAPAALGLCVAAAGAAMIGLLFPDPADIPMRWITVLHEGLSRQNISQLHADGAHAGLNFIFLADTLTPGPGRDLPGVVRMNMLLAALNAGLFAGIAWFVLRSFWAAVLFTLAFAGNAAFLNSAVSELPSQALTAYMLMGIVSSALLAPRPDAGPWRWCAAAALALLGAASALCRVEALICWLPAAAAAAARLRWGDAALVAGWRRFWSAAAGVLKWSRGRQLALLAVLLVLQLGFLPSRIQWSLNAVNPADLSPVVLPAFFSYFLPMGFVALFILGLVHAFRHPVKFLFLPLSLLVLFKLYHSASHRVFGAVPVDVEI